MWIAEIEGHWLRDHVHYAVNAYCDGEISYGYFHYLMDDYSDD